LDHLAYIDLEHGPPEDEVAALFELSAVPNLYMKVSTRNLSAVTIDQRATRDFFRRLVDCFGPDRVMWGSNFTASHDRSYADMVALARDVFSFLTAGDLDLVMGGTALRVWPGLAR
jgi:predicted TIM-barrel fold metal-dependent hydrolase